MVEMEENINLLSTYYMPGNVSQSAQVMALDLPSHKFHVVLTIIST